MTQRYRIETLWWLLPAAAAILAGISHNWDVLRQPPYYDEMWRLNIATAPNPIAALLAFETPVPPGWLCLIKALLYLKPSVVLGRAISILWLGAAASLLLGLVPPERRDWPLLLAACFVAVSPTLHDVARNFNQYSFEIFFGVALVAVTVTPLTTAWRKRAAYAIILLTPLMTISSIFFLPVAVLARLWLAPSRRDRLELAAVSAATLALALAVYSLLYRPIITQNGVHLMEFWADYNVRFNPPKFLAILATFPEQIARSVLADVPGTGPYRLVSVIGALLSIGAGYLALWRRSWLAAIAIAAAVLIAIAFPFFSLWPLGLDELRRVNLGWAWTFYFLFAFGLCAALQWITALLFGGRTAVALASCAALAAFSMLLGSKAFARYLPDNTTFRSLYLEISDTLSRADPPQAIYQFHFMAHCYAEFLARTKTGGRTAVFLEPRADEGAQAAFLRSVTDRLGQLPGIRQFVIFVPFGRAKQPGELRQIALPGFRLTEMRAAHETYTLRYDRIGP